MKSPLICLLLPLLSLQAAAQSAKTAGEVDAAYPQSEALYLDLHQHPELSLYEQQTAAKMAAGLRKLGYEVTTGVGGTGRNPDAPVVLSSKQRTSRGSNTCWG